MHAISDRETSKREQQNKELNYVQLETTSYYNMKIMTCSKS